LARRLKRRLRLVFTCVVIILTIIISANLIIKTKYPIGYKDYINKYSKEYDIDPYLIASIINVESNFDVNAKSSKDARGLMQISPITAEWAAKELNLTNFTLESLYEPETNIKIGCWYLSVLTKEYDNNLEVILAAYNGGSGNVNKWLSDKKYSDDGKNLKEIPFKETAEYVKKVIKNCEMYEKIYKDNIDDSDSADFQFIMLINNFKKVIKQYIFQNG